MHNKYAHFQRNFPKDFIAKNIICSMQHKKHTQQQQNVLNYVRIMK